MLKLWKHNDEKKNFMKKKFCSLYIFDKMNEYWDILKNPRFLHKSLCYFFRFILQIHKSRGIHMHFAKTDIALFWKVTLLLLGRSIAKPFLPITHNNFLPISLLKLANRSLMPNFYTSIAQVPKGGLFKLQNKNYKGPGFYYGARECRCLMT